MSGPRLARRHILAAVLGNALEFYDFLTFAFFAIQIGHAFFPGDAYGRLVRPICRAAPNTPG